MVARLFPATMKRVAIRWVDEEKEGITISDDRDLREALESLSGEGDRLLRIVISVEDLGLRLSTSVKAFLERFDAKSVVSDFDTVSTISATKALVRGDDIHSKGLKSPRASIERWKDIVSKGIFTIPMLSFILLPMLIFIIPVAFPYLFIKLVKDRKNRLGIILTLAVYPFGPIIEFFFVVLLLIFIPLWIPVGSLLFGTSAGCGLSFIFAASSRGIGIIALPIFVITTAGIWFGIGLGLSVLLVATTIPVAGLLAPLWLPLCCVAWYVLIPAFYFDLVTECGWDELFMVLGSELSKRLHGLTNP